MQHGPRVLLICLFSSASLLLVMRSSKLAMLAMLGTAALAGQNNGACSDRLRSPSPRVPLSQQAKSGRS